MTWILLIAGAVFLCRLVIVQFAIHADESSIRASWEDFPAALSENLSREVVAADYLTPKAREHELTCAVETLSSSEQPTKPKKAWKGWRDMRVERTVDESPTCRSFYLTPSDGGDLPKFLGGQYLLVGVNDPVSGKMVSRCYSLSSVFGTGFLRITVKRVPGGKFSNLLHDSVSAGDILQAQAPSGRFHLDEAETVEPLNLIAAGIGITPMVSMLHHSQKVTPERPVRLFYQLRDGSDAPFLSTLRAIAAEARATGKFKLFVAFSRPAANDLQVHDAKGRMSAAMVVGAARGPRGQFMICGPDEFMSSMAEGLVAQGVPENNVMYESFGPSSGGIGAIAVQASPSPERESVTDQASDITFTKSNQTAQWTGEDQTLLDVAERVGVSVDSACRSGNCGPCVVRLLQGQVTYDGTPDFEVEDDEVLMCVARPCGSLRLDVWKTRPHRRGVDVD